jgi:CHAD domain-containing protein
MRRHPSSAPTLGPLLEHVRRRRRGLLADARRFFASPLFFRQRRQLEAHLARARHGPAPHLSALAKRQVNKRLAKVLEFPTDLESLSESRFHQLRIACKRLRYCCEFFQPVDPKTLGDLAKAARKMQTCIGEHRDAGLFLERVRAWQVRPSRPRSGKPMERLIQALEQVRKRRLAQAQQEWRKLRRGRAGRKGRVQLHVAHPWDLRETVVI